MGDIMGLTSSLSTGLSGLAANQAQLDVIGNNISNVNTTGFKTSNLDFKTQFSQTFSYGTAPDSTTGGTNPVQVGMGTTQAAITTNFGNGSLQTTGVNTDLAVQETSFFVLQGDHQSYTRDGSFQLNGSHVLVNGDGQRVQGFGVDSNFNVVPGVLQDITVPIGSLTIAQATSNSVMTGQLDSGGTVATSVADINLGPPMYLAGAGAVDPTNPPVASTLLTNVTDATNTPLFQVGDVLTATGLKGGRNIPAQTLTVTGTTTLGDLQAFFQGTLGINTTAGINGSATAPGVTVPATGNTASLQIDGNLGASNDLTLDATSLSIKRAGNTITPFTAVTQNAHANGESIYTTFTAYDSLGNPVVTGVTATLIGKNSSGTTWGFNADSPDSTGSGVNINQTAGQGTISFDTKGQYVSATTPTVTVNRARHRRDALLTFSLDFSHLNSSANPVSTTSSSTLSSDNQDGAPLPESLNPFRSVKPASSSAPSAVVTSPASLARSPWRRFQIMRDSSTPATTSSPPAPIPAPPSSLLPTSSPPAPWWPARWNSPTSISPANL